MSISVLVDQNPTEKLLMENLNCGLCQFETEDERKLDSHIVECHTKKPVITFNVEQISPDPNREQLPL